ncbi:ABC transporter ATP-binding protein [Deinococcus radiomollis]|uniref:ABC transporter ATP-binding protein n=1 Tax=Deinococcus radiomollis TaxID=468916 RepID=UPI00389252C5
MQPEMKPGASLLELQSVSKTYAAVPAVQDVSLTLHSGETLALLGPSGCGKSTLLRLIAGLERPDAGRVCMAGQDVTLSPPERRNLSMVFQDYALFPHLNMGDNVAYGPRMRGVNRQAARATALKALARVGLAGLEGRRIHELSGGQQQRVALARALAPGPSLLLLDEPLSNLDEQLRTSLRRDLSRLFAETRAGVLLVTHDQREALSLAGRVALMRAGKVVQTGETGEVFRRPVSAWAAAFLGERNLFVQPGGVLMVPERAIVLGKGEAWTVLERVPSEDGMRVRLAHPLGPLSVTLSPREAALLTGPGLQAEINMAECLTLPDDRDV